MFRFVTEAGWKPAPQLRSGFCGAGFQPALQSRIGSNLHVDAVCVADGLLVGIWGGTYQIGRGNNRGDHQACDTRDEPTMSHCGLPLDPEAEETAGLEDDDGDDPREDG